ncbi:BUD13 homolog isoform X2 [Lampris incognitus]|uniref:BUD13 homolog isoform X2 n=1 Tax=Lampris incognitus TaxID=2546036 RepID=UPI0024B63377|nr:BUD13 homolog isoform X2 [Lampris incognitus]
MMAASAGSSKGLELSKAEYLKRYLSADQDDTMKVKKKRRKVSDKRMKIVDDDIVWNQTISKAEEIEEDDEEAPVVAEVIDDRPDEVRLLEAFRSSSKWRVMGDDESKADNREERGNQFREPVASGRTRHDSPEPTTARWNRHDSPEVQSVQKPHHGSSNITPPRRCRHDSPDMSPRRQNSGKTRKVQSRESSPIRRKLDSGKKQSPQWSPLAKRAQNRHDSDSDQSLPRKKSLKGEASDSDQSPPRRRPKSGQGSDSDQSPPRRRPKSCQGSDSDQSPPRRQTRGGRSSDNDLSPPRRPGQSQGQRMLTGGKAGLVSIDVLRKEQEENRRREKTNQPLEDESRNAQTVFRDKSGKKRDLDSEREDQKKKAGEKALKDEKYAQWGKGLVQNQMQQQKVADALHEIQKPLARHWDDEDLDRMLREQERDGDPMAAMLRRKKDRNSKLQGIKERPQYKGPAPPPNRFNILPGYRWDGVNRSNGFEQKRYTRMADKKAVQEEAYKWSVEDM